MHPDACTPLYRRNRLSARWLVRACDCGFALSLARREGLDYANRFTS